MSRERKSKAGQRPRPDYEPSVFLVDNGSLEPAATRQLGKIATALGKRLKRRVEPVSLLHSNKVPATELGGRNAEILDEAVQRRLGAGVREFVIVPLFFGRSRALTEFIPELVKRWRKQIPETKVEIAPPLAAKGDDRLARILERQVRTKLTREFLRGQSARVALVDHGSPLKEVTRIRNRVATQLRRRLGATVAGVAACSMERRPGPAYAFNEPLLEALLAKPRWRSGPVIVAQLFLLPGRHAGPGGDLERICQEARAKSAGLRTARTKLIGDDSALVAILADRFRTTQT